MIDFYQWIYSYFELEMRFRRVPWLQKCKDQSKYCLATLLVLLVVVSDKITSHRELYLGNTVNGGKTYSIISRKSIQCFREKGIRCFRGKEDYRLWFCNVTWKRVLLSRREDFNILS